MKIDIVLGAGFGDEGKGAFVNHLCSKRKNPLVVRFSGGHQVGHTVVTADNRHVFSNFGSGTLIGIPTYWSEYCTVSPIGIFKEGKVLENLGVKPKLILNPNAMITTPFDIWKNQKNETVNNHGSVGVGFGTTIQRNEDHYHLFVRDLQYPKIREIKLNLIKEKYYGYSGNKMHTIVDKLIADFYVACDHILENYAISTLDEVMDNLQYADLIFEGSQGIMLDQDYGFFPHVTRSYTTSRNAIEIIEKLGFCRFADLNTYYITRAYQTRHGNGQMSNEGLDISYIKENPLETNVNGGFQGDFRKSVLDIDLLKYAIECDTFHNPDSYKNIVITCLDQVPEDIPILFNDKLNTLKYTDIASYLNISNTYSTFSDEGFK